MTIFIPSIGNSGSAVFDSRLHEALTENKINSFIRYFPLRYSYCALILKYIPINGNIDIIHSNADHGYFFHRKGKKLVLTIHHLVKDSQYAKYATFLQRAYHKIYIERYLKKALRIADKIIAVSNFTKDIVLKEIGQYDIEVIYNGIDENVFKPIQSKNTDGKKIRLLHTGNLIRRKGADLLPKILDLLGEGFELYYTYGLRTKKILKNRIGNLKPLGKLSESGLVEQYNRADIILFPTRREGFGYLAVEGMACGKPIIATNCSSLPELVDDGKGGFLCEIDNVDDFVEKIRILGDSPELRRQMGGYNRQKVLEKFTMKQMVERYIQIYQEVRSSPIL